jgi:acyl carrier protein
MVHTHESLLAQIKIILQEQFDIEPDAVQLNARLREDLDIDSIDAVNLMIELKSLTAKKIALENFHQVKTVQNLLDAILAFLAQDSGKASE